MGLRLSSSLGARQVCMRRDMTQRDWVESYGYNSESIFSVARLSIHSMYLANSRSPNSLEHVMAANNTLFEVDNYRSIASAVVV